MPHISTPSLKIAKDSIQTSILALQKASESLGNTFNKAVELIANHKGKLIICGVGKSGHVAQKVAATFCSIGIPAVFLNPNEALHGDLGLYQPGDPTILFSRSGSTVELTKLIPILRQFHSPLIAIVGNPSSTLAKAADIFIDASIEKEGDPLGIVPSTSVVVSLALADALASAVMLKHSFAKEDFARFHPGGQLGKNLLYTVADIMHKKENVPFIYEHSSLREAIIAMTQNPLGAVCVLDTSHQQLKGLITDGDIRRLLVKQDDIKNLWVKDAMVSNPFTINPDCLIGQALQVMEDRPANKQLSVLPVVDNQNQYVGLIRLHDIYQSY